jgi:hypothetical protein
MYQNSCLIIPGTDPYWYKFLVSNFINTVKPLFIVFIGGSEKETMVLGKQ